MPVAILAGWIYFQIGSDQVGFASFQIGGDMRPRCISDEVSVALAGGDLKTLKACWVCRESDVCDVCSGSLTCSHHSDWLRDIRR